MYAAFGGVAWATKDMDAWYPTGYPLFLYLTSYLHYCRYIHLFYVRDASQHAAFKRDVLLYKTVSLGQLFYLYLSATQWMRDPDWVGIAMVVAGYFTSIMATKALGVDRTYFGIELGLCKFEYTAQWPYGPALGGLLPGIPHPMITAQQFALLGLYKADAFRAAWPYLVPGHLVLYTAHMLQEIFDINVNGRKEKPKKV